jgi:hemoglobin-like flavoprotein/uncharacterized protein YjbI with pentapeptide repeats
MPLNVELLEQSFEQIKPRAEEFAASFYENLFAAHPEVRPLFANTDMVKQQKKLINSLVLVVENLRSPETLGEVLSALGARHIGYGAIAKHYGPVGEALLLSFEQYLQDDWTPEVKLAWVNAYTAVTTLMLKGAGEEYAPEKVQSQTKAIPHKQVATAPAESNIEAVAEEQPQELPIELLESSFSLVKPRAEEFAASFYENLFAAHPEVRPLFANTDMVKQQKKLINSLVLVVENLRSPETLGEVLSALGARHIGYGAIAKHYGPVGEALLLSFEQYLQDDWTPEVKLAWVNAYTAVTALMLKGAYQASSPTVVRDEKAPTKEIPSESKAELNGESKEFQPEAEQQKKLIISIQRAGEIPKQIFGKITETYQEIPTQLSKKQLGATVSQFFAKILDAFWTQPAWLVALVSAVLFIIVYVIADENSLLAEVLESADALSLVVALVLFIKEAPERRKQFHYQAWSTVDAAHGVKVSYARILALQDLNADGVSLRGLDNPGAELVEINLSKANLSAANLSETDLSKANLSYANLDNANLSQAKLSGANLSHAKLGFARLGQANLSSANLSSANLICADLSNANMSGANLKNASLSGANLDGAYLSGANLKGAKVSIFELSGAFIEGTIMPDGTKNRSSKDSK